MSGTYDESILDETKKVLGIAEDVTVFDPDIRMHINSALGTLNQLGIGPEGGFEVVNTTQAWSDFLASDLKLSPVKSYVFLRVKMLFDPPPNSWATVAMKEQIEQLEWRLNAVREDAIPVPSPPLPDEEDQYWLDGGVI
jgi:glutamate/tyrosine decarboxylase-like PLP-dependent enzyme